MPWFEGTHSETRTLKADAASVLAHIQNPQSIIDATKGVEKATLTDGVVHFQMEEEDHQVVKFKGDFQCRYETTENGVKWTSLDGGNMNQSGEAKVVATDGGCELHYTETAKIDLGVPAMMAPMLKPMIGPMIAKEIEGFVGRLVQPLA